LFKACSLSQTPSTGSGDRALHISTIFQVLIKGLGPIWPQRESIAGVALGDVWPCTALAQKDLAIHPGTAGDISSTVDVRLSPETRLDTDVEQKKAEIMVPFHKLTQWLAYSLIVPLQTYLELTIEGLEDMTGLPEYRNGGLFVDFSVLKLRQETVASAYPRGEGASTPRFLASHPAIVEWRAMTVILLDRIAVQLRKRFSAPLLTLPQVLESATWKGGREIARSRRRESGGPPIEIESDGTVF